MQLRDIPADHHPRRHSEYYHPAHLNSGGKVIWDMIERCAKRVNGRESEISDDVMKIIYESREQGGFGLMCTLGAKRASSKRLETALKSRD